MHLPTRLTQARAREAASFTIPDGRSWPFAFEHRHSRGNTAWYVPLGVGHIAAERGYPPSEGGLKPPFRLVTQALRDTVAAALDRAWVQNPNDDWDSPEVPVVHRAPLRGGGVVVFAGHIPELAPGGPLECGKERRRVVISGVAAADAPLVSVTSGERYAANDHGIVVVSLPVCGSDLLLSQARLAHFTRPRQARESPAFASSRPPFFARVSYMDLQGATPYRACLAERLVDLGYERSSPGIRHSPDYKEWFIEPVRGFYPSDDFSKEARPELFGVLALDGWSQTHGPRLLGTIERHLEDETRKLIVWHAGALPAELAALRSRYPEQTWVLPECGDRMGVSLAALKAFLES